MSKFITVIGFCSTDAAKAEKLCDWIYELDGKKRSGHCLLIASPDVHEEMQIKVKISAEVAFESVDLYVAKPSTLETHGGKYEQVNNLFGQAALKVSRTYNWPWLWLEPDCVPLVPYWREQLWSAYQTQPKQYMGSILKYSGEEEVEKFLVSRVAMYPFFAYAELAKFVANVVPFESLASDASVPKTTKSKLFQHIHITKAEDCNNIRSDAVLLHSDKEGHAIKWARKKLAQIHEAHVFGTVLVPELDKSVLQAVQGNAVVDKTIVQIKGAVESDGESAVAVAMIPPKRRGWPKGKPRKKICQ